MKNTLEDWYVRWQVRLLLLAGQKAQALARIEHHLALRPDDAYALATRAHLQAELGDKAGAIGSI